MPLNQEAMALEPGPRSVKEARRWVGDACRRIGRGELAEAAEMGTSELVGNALLHAGPPIKLRMRGTREHPRVEVFDGSHLPPSPNSRMTSDEELLSTVGRGLGLVAMCSTAWGAEIQRAGKIVWFEPAARIADEPTVVGDLYVAEPAQPPLRVEEGRTLELLDLPTQPYADFVQHYQELRRELRLLALAHGDAYPLAVSLSSAFRAFDEALSRADGLDGLDTALERDAEFVDVILVVAPGSADSAGRMIDILELADAFCRSERLLALATTPEQRDFQRWYLGEFVQQGAGELPTAWTTSHHADASGATPGRS